MSLVLFLSLFVAVVGFATLCCNIYCTFYILHAACSFLALECFLFFFSYSFWALLIVNLATPVQVLCFLGVARGYSWALNESYANISLYPSVYTCWLERFIRPEDKTQPFPQVNGRGFKIPPHPPQLDANVQQLNNLGSGLSRGSRSSTKPNFNLNRQQVFANLLRLALHLHNYFCVHAGDADRRMGECEAEGGLVQWAS